MASPGAIASSRLGRASRVAELSREAKLPPAPPPKPAPPPPQKMATSTQGIDPYAARYQELMRRVQQADPPADGMTRLYRVGETRTNYRPPQTVRMYGQDVPYAEWQALRAAAVQDQVAKGLRVRDTNPAGAAGRWATDAPHELDFYINENELDAPIYSFDVPAEDVPRFNVRNTPYESSSKNHDREFVLPKGPLKKAVRIMAVPALIGAGASSQQPGLLDGLREQP